MLGSYNVEEPGPLRLSIAKIMRKWIDEGRSIQFGIRIAVYSRVKARERGSGAPHSRYFRGRSS